MKAHYLIVGNSAAGIAAAEAIREIDRGSSVVIVSDEPYPAYSRPLISKYLAGDRKFEAMLYRPSGFYQELGITAMLGKAVTNLDLDSHEAVLKDGERLQWDKLLLACGASPIIPNITGTGKRGVLPFLTLDHARAMDNLIGKDCSAVVIGGGLIGLSVAEALYKRGVSACIVEMRDGILGTILDADASAMAEQHISRAGIRFITGATVTRVLGKDRVSGVALDGGERIACNLVVLAAGVVPRTDLARQCGLQVNRGIVVDRHLCTSHPDIYAAGDAAEVYDFVEGKSRVIPIWPGAYLSGRTAGLNMAGRKTEFPGSTPMNSLNYFGLDVASAGVVDVPAGSGWETILAQNGNGYRKVVLKDGRLAGFLLVGNVDNSGLLYGLMRDGVTVNTYKDTLLREDFGLAFMPAHIRRERLGVAAGPNTNLAGGVR